MKKAILFISLLFLSGCCEDGVVIKLQNGIICKNYRYSNCGYTAWNCSDNANSEYSCLTNVQFINAKGKINE